MSVTRYKVSPCDRREVKDFIEKWHYSGSINGIKSSYCFKLEDGDKLIGAMVFGRLAMASVWKKYVEERDHMLELRRLCCIDDTPKNTESYFIGAALRWLRKHTDVRKIISYADPRFGHSGTIYKATNFDHIGMTSRGRVIKWNDREYHDKTIRTRYNGKLKPYAKRVKDALERGDASYVETPSKHIYMYSFGGG